MLRIAEGDIPRSVYLLSEDREGIPRSGPRTHVGGKGPGRTRIFGDAKIL